MAGIGFTLQRMTKGNSLSVAAGAYLYAAFLVAGPWIFTMLGIAATSSIACDGPCMQVQIFRSVVIYNSVFSLVLTSPLAFVCGRFASDQIFAKQYSSITFTFFVSLGIFSLITALLAVPFYLFATTLSGYEQIAALQNLVLIGASWLLIPFLGAMRSLREVSKAFGIGALVMVAAVRFASDIEPFWLLNGFNLGLCAVNMFLILRLFREYGVEIIPARSLFNSALRYWDLAMLGLTYGAALWVDKLIMWFWATRGTVRIAGGLQTMPDYDTPMFWAQLAALPVIAGFFVHIETRFFSLCRDFYGRIAEGASRRELRLGMTALIGFVYKSIAGLLGTLMAIAAFSILLSFVAIERFGLHASQMGILRNALIGMVFQVSTTFCIILLLYLDLRRPALIISTTLLLLNGGLTFLFLPLGSAYYGYGNMLASLFSFSLAVVLFIRELSWLHFHAFITNNSSLYVRVASIEEPPPIDQTILGRKLINGIPERAK
jgi:uncharacterized membrane protein